MMGMFEKVLENGAVAILKRETALELIREKHLEKLELMAFHWDGLVVGLGLDFEWAWDVELIQKFLNENGVRLVREELEFYGLESKPFPIFILKDGWNKALCVAPVTGSGSV